MKSKLLSFLIATISLSAFAQGKIGFTTDTLHLAYYDPVLAPGGLAGNAISSGDMPPGVTLMADLYMGTSSSTLFLYSSTTFSTTAGRWNFIGVQANTNAITGAPAIPAGTRAFVVAQIRDSAAAPANQLDGALLQAGGNYAAALGYGWFGWSQEFQFTIASGVTYPVMYGPGGTWAQGTYDLSSSAGSGARGAVAVAPVPAATNRAPVILSQPQSLSVTVGSNATLNASASGSQPLSYQWRKGGVAINGTTNSAISFTGVALSDAANYDVVCSNQIGTAVSSNAVLQVLPYGAPSTRVNGALAVGTVQSVAQATITISGGFTNGIIFYTLDGSQPTTSSPVYNGPITVTSNATVQAMSLSADFTQTSTAPAVTVAIIPVYNVQTSVSGDGTVTVTPTNGPYASNSVVTLTANAATNWAFDHWTGDLSGTNNPETLVMNGPRNVTAVFLPTIYPLTVSSPGGGSVTVNGQTIASNTFYPSGSTVELAGNASNGWSFVQWQGTTFDTANPLNLLMNQTNDVEAIFGTVVATHVGGRGSILMSQPNPVPFGTALTLTAVPATGFYFAAWSGAASGTDNPTTLTVTNANPVVGAFFGGAPTLTIKLTTTNTVIVSWPSPSTGWIPLVNTDLTTGTWVTPPEPVNDNGTQKYIIVNPAAGSRFYGLGTQ